MKSSKHAVMALILIFIMMGSTIAYAFLSNIISPAAEDEEEVDAPLDEIAPHGRESRRDSPSSPGAARI